MLLASRPERAQCQRTQTDETTELCGDKTNKANSNLCLFPLSRFSLHCIIILVMFPEIRGYLPISAVFVHILRFVAGFQLHRPCSPLTASKQTIKYVKTICTVQETEQRNHSGGAKYAARERRQEKQAVLIRTEWDQCSSIRAKSNPLSP